ncbi:hypothetical protein PVK06_019804 [Gossypium arboreum]|uniref:Peptidase S54 rhomboid domain-containing protein n=1 Tax=Gossypium arboreum TaxID=29729 RepID=A0ABR0PKT2_GOSAR|nr:hypothetical protein PVK06_019804 [Gossypium arboreum]
MLDLTENPKLVSLDNFKSGRLHTLITSAFSHIDIEHIMSNMIRLYFFGYNIGRIFGPEYLLRLFLAGAMGGSVFYLVHHAFLAKPLMLIVLDKQDIYALLKQMLSSSFLSPVLNI